MEKSNYAYEQHSVPPPYGPNTPSHVHGPPHSQPVVTQQPAVSHTVFVQQPTVIVSGPRPWSSGICACCEDMFICCCVYWCTLCYQSHLATKMGENCCVPCCVPGALIAMRAHFRGKHNITGSLMDDCCMYTCCYPCTLCQLAREVDLVEKQGTYVVSGGTNVVMT